MASNKGFLELKERLAKPRKRAKQLEVLQTLIEMSPAQEHDAQIREQEIEARVHEAELQRDVSIARSRMIRDVCVVALVVLLIALIWIF